MTTDLVTLSPNNTVRDATIRLAVENISGAPVVDENYRMVGILSGNDILELIMKYDRKMGDDLRDHMLSFYMDADVKDPALKKVANFFKGKYEGVPLTESFEIMAMLEAAELSLQYGGRTMPVYQFPKL